MTGTLLRSRRRRRISNPSKPGQHDIQHHQVRAAPGGPLQAAKAFVLAVHGEAFALEEFPQEGAELRVVVNQQDAHG